MWRKLFILVGLAAIAVIMFRPLDSESVRPELKDTVDLKQALVEEIPRGESPERLIPDSKELTEILAQASVAIRNQDAVRHEIAVNPHITPQSIQEGGRLIGEVSAQEVRYPQHKYQIQEFYLNCAEDETTITVLRVQCLLRYVRSRQLSTQETRSLLAGMPGSVRNLYVRFMETR